MQVVNGQHWRIALRFRSAMMGTDCLCYLPKGLYLSALQIPSKYITIPSIGTVRLFSTLKIYCLQVNLSYLPTTSSNPSKSASNLPTCATYLPQHICYLRLPRTYSLPTSISNQLVSTAPLMSISCLPKKAFHLPTNMR